MRANNTALIKYIKVISAVPTKWLDNPPLLGSFDYFEENVGQTIINLSIV